MVTFLILIITLSVGSVSTSIDGQVFKNQAVDSNMFSERTLFNVDTRSSGHCALLCHHVDCCLTFTFDKVTRLCQGHFAVVTVNTASSPAAGATTFSRENEESWLMRPCTHDEECPTTSGCGVGCDSDVGQCSCSPYFYYSVSLNTCVPSCSALHTTYVRGYVGYDLSGPVDMAWILALSANLQECKDWCNSHPACRLIHYDPTSHRGPTCYFKNSTAAELPDRWYKRRPEVENFQKKCE
ncbi:uncharacterized protein [Littorina saxatilis]|uniref:uncharacterized protein n=1 Tax=Littorina saxatilis TaxID=31220 RepID=UPI0038B63335